MQPNRMCSESPNLQGTGAERKKDRSRKIKLREAGEQGDREGALLHPPPSLPLCVPNPNAVNTATERDMYLIALSSDKLSSGCA